MTTKHGYDYQITEVSLQRAIEQNIYVKIGDKPGKLTIAGAIRRWAEDEHKDDLYIPWLRVVGTEKEIQNWMIKNGYPKADINRAIDNAYAYDTTEDPEFLKEYKEARKTFAWEDGTPMEVMTNFNVTFARLLEQNEGKLVIRIRNLKNEEKTSPTRRKFHKKTRATAPAALVVKEGDEAVVILEEDDEEEEEENILLKKKPRRQPIKTPQLSTPKKATKVEQAPVLPPTAKKMLPPIRRKSG
jgi:hypothetical protein